MAAGMILKSSDLDRTIGWYRSAGFRLRARHADEGREWCEVVLGDTAIQFLAGETPWEGAPALTGCVYVAIDDADAALAALGPGVEAELGIEDRVWGTREIVLRDPDGYHVALTQSVED